MPIGLSTAAIVGGGLAAAGAVGSAVIGSSAAGKASRAQQDAQTQALEYQKQQDAQARQDFAPFLGAGQQAIGQQGALVGLNGAPAQQAAIDQLKMSPLYQSLYNNGQEAVLQNASATGGLRGGNTQRSLANFGADTLSSVIAQQLANLGGISSLGAGVAGNQAQIGQQNANQVSQGYSNIGDARASGALGQANAITNGINGVSNSFGKFFGGGFGGGGGGVGYGGSIVPSFNPSTLGGNAFSLGGSAYQAPLGPLGF